jgi:hypothetical protein
MKRLSRRHLLRGAAGIGVGLPLLEAMLPGLASAEPGGIPKRFVLSYGGISAGQGSSNPAPLPKVVGTGYEITRAFKPIADLGLQNDMTIVSGLTIPNVQWGTTPPPGGIAAQQFHLNTVAPQIAGTHTTLMELKGGGIWRPTAPTADRLVSDVIGGGKEVLAYRVQAHHYHNHTSAVGADFSLSFKRNTSGGISVVDPISSPRVAYEALFSGFTGDPAQAERAAFLLRQKQSVLDYVTGDIKSLLPRLASGDRQRLEQHFEYIQAMEAKLKAIEPSCAAPAAPGNDPPIGGALFDVSGKNIASYTGTAGYSNEDLRADVLSDFIAMAFACDLARVASFMQTSWKCYMNAYAFTGAQSDVHGLTHVDNQLNILSDGMAFFVKQLARLAKKLKAIPQSDGGTALDHSAMVLLFEGGFGHSTDNGSPNSAHSAENMVAVVAGRAGGLKAGVHVKGGGAHPAKVVISAMQAVGGPSKLGEVSGALPGLL